MIFPEWHTPSFEYWAGAKDNIHQYIIPYKMYEYVNNTLSIPARLLYEDWQLTSYDNYHKMCKRGKIERTQRACKGKEAMLDFLSLPQHIKAVAIDKLGHPNDTMTINVIEKHLRPDAAAISFYAQHRKPNGKPLSLEDQKEKATNAMILIAIYDILSNPLHRRQAFGKGSTHIWTEITNAVNQLNTFKWPHNLPGSYKRLKKKYKAFTLTATPKERTFNYWVFIHALEGSQNAVKITGDTDVRWQICLSDELKEKVIKITPEYEH